MRRLTKPSPELRDMCRHHEPGLPCGIDGRPCVGHKKQVRIERKKVTIAEYRHTPFEWVDGQPVEQPVVMCPRLWRILYEVPDM